MIMIQKDINRKHLVHLGKILNNYAILGGVFLLLTALFPFFTAVYYLAAVAIALALMITVVFFETGYNILTNLNDEIYNMLYGYMNGLVPYVFGFTAVFAAISIALVTRDANNKHIARIVFAAISILSGTAALIIYLKGGIQ